MQKIWLKHYPKGVPAEIDPNAYRSVKAVLEASCRRFENLPAFTNLGTTLTYADIDQQSRYFAAYLQKVAGLAKGERVAIMMPNLLQYPVVLFGILRAGGVVVNVNPLYTAREVEYEMKDCGARVMIVLENFAATLAAALPQTKINTVVVTRVGDLLPAPKRWLVNFAVKYVQRQVPAYNIAEATRFRRALTEGKWQTLDAVDLGPEDLAFLQYTGGTTGRAKGAMLTHGNMVANMEQAFAWLRPALDEDGGEIVMTALPLYHIFCLLANCLVFMRIGGRNWLITDPRDLPTFVKELRKAKCTAITGVNTLFNGLLNTSGFKKLDFTNLKLTLGGGMAVQRAVAERWRKVTGVPLLEAYGLTEASPGVCVNPLRGTDYTGSAGLPLPSTEVAIRDEDGHDVSLGETGEVCVRGPQVMRGYWEQPAETERVLSSDGWLRTGDMGRMDERGYVYLVDRKKDMIVVSGFNVYPNEIEDVLAELPEVKECAAVGVPDEHSGEAVKVFVVKKDSKLSKERVIEHCKKNLTGYKVPKQVEFRETLPKSNVGKILRRELREEPSEAHAENEE